MVVYLSHLFLLLKVVSSAPSDHEQNVLSIASDRNFLKEPITHGWLAEFDSHTDNRQQTQLLGAGSADFLNLVQAAPAGSHDLCVDSPWTAWLLSDGVKVVGTHAHEIKGYCETFKAGGRCSSMPSIAAKLCPVTCGSPASSCECVDRPELLRALVDKNTKIKSCSGQKPYCDTHPGLGLACEATCGCPYDEKVHCGKYNVNLIPGCPPNEFHNKTTSVESRKKEK